MTNRPCVRVQADAFANGGGFRPRSGGGMTHLPGSRSLPDAFANDAGSRQREVVA